MTSCYAYEATRYVRSRHVGACDGEMCSGCQPCGDRHCPCGNHLATDEFACPRCVGKVRDDLTHIEELTALMPEEAEHKGVNSEAANLAGPAANTEAWSWRKAHLAKSIPWDQLDDDDEHHPKSVLEPWERAFREDWDEATDLDWTLSRCLDYLRSRLTVLSRDSSQDFQQFAREIRRCRAHLEAVLHDQNIGDPANIGCFECGAGLQRRLTDRGFEDHWTCKGCRRRYTYAEYNFALRAALEGRTA